MAYIFGFKTPAARTYYLILGTISLAFAALNSKSVFINSVYCNPFSDNNGVLECYKFLQPQSRQWWYIFLHLTTCLPGLALAVTQFNPTIRGKYPAVHRWVGRTCMILGPTAILSGLALSEDAFGSKFATISSCAFLAALTLLGHYQAYRAIRVRKIHKHRRWMLRTWVWLGTILTMRPITFLMALALTWWEKTFSQDLKTSMLCTRLVHVMSLSVNGTITALGTPANIFKYYADECLKPGISAADRSSLELLFDAQLSNKSASVPPVFLNAIRPDAMVQVSAAIDTNRLDRSVGMIDITFGWALWFAIILHIVLVEVWLKYTHAEHERLKRVSDLQRKAMSKRLEGKAQ